MAKLTVGGEVTIDYVGSFAVWLCKAAATQSGRRSDAHAGRLGPRRESAARSTTASHVDSV